MYQRVADCRLEFDSLIVLTEKLLLWFLAYRYLLCNRTVNLDSGIEVDQELH